MHRPVCVTENSYVGGAYQRMRNRPANIEVKLIYDLILKAFASSALLAKSSRFFLSKPPGKSCVGRYNEVRGICRNHSCPLWLLAF